MPSLSYYKKRRLRKIANSLFASVLSLPYAREDRLLNFPDLSWNFPLASQWYANQILPVPRYESTPYHTWNSLYFLFLHPTAEDFHSEECNSLLRKYCPCQSPATFRTLAWSPHSRMPNTIRSCLLYSYPYWNPTVAESALFQHQ